jgi:hypothetical protein
MSNPVDSAIENAENQSREGQKRGPRDRYYFCAAIRGKGKDQHIVEDAIMASSPDEAKEIFEEMHEVEPLTVNDGSKLKGGGNGFYLAMGTGMSDAQRISVTVTPAQLARRTTKAIKAQFKGWHVYGSGLAACTVKVGSEDHDFEDDDLFSIEFGDRVDPKSKLPKPKLKKKEVVRASDLEHVQNI